MVPPVLAVDLVGHDPRSLRGRTGHEDLGRDAEAKDAAEFRRVPRRAQRPSGAARPPNR